MLIHDIKINVANLSSLNYELDDPELPFGWL